VPTRADLADDQSVADLALTIDREFGGLDILVHSAGEYGRGTVETASVADFDKHYRANVRAQYLLTQTVLPLLKRAQGQIIFINSSQGLAASAETVQYAATMHAMKGVAEGIRAAVNAAGIRVTTLFLGRTATPRVEGIFEAEGKPYHPELLMQPEDVAHAVLAALELPATAEITSITIRPMLKSY
jgi:NADP-dependent 3-hydroxy acid dehydrogenase YdfG